MVSAHHVERYGRSKPLYTLVDESAERRFAVLYVIHHIAGIEKSVARFVIAKIKQRV